MSTTIAIRLDAAIDVLAFARQRRLDALRAEADVLVAAVAWAEQHPVESIQDAACVPGAEGELAVAGPGAPMVAEFCVAELGAALSMSTDAARSLVGDAVELAHRLPRVYHRVVAGDLPVWRARRIAQATMSLPPEAAEFVDAEVATIAHKVGLIVLDRLVATAIARFDPARAEADALAAADRRRVRLYDGQVSYAGTCDLDGELDLRDALDLDDALSRIAEELRLGGSPLGLDARRAQALGMLARGESTVAGGSVERAVVVHVHLDRDGLATTEEHRRLVTVDQVRDWCQSAGTSVTIKPVIDLDATITSGGYQPSDTLAEQIRLRDRHCVFPWCTRPARRCDLDHITAHDHGGATSSENLAPLCRRHHRLKTHSPWTYTLIEPGVFLWTSPRGHHYLRDPDGTEPLDP